MLLHWAEPLSAVGAAGALAGAVLLTLSLGADLTIHDRRHHELMERLLPQCAQLVADHQAREDANPWHRTLATGEALLVLGLGGLYLSERARFRVSGFRDRVTVPRPLTPDT